MFQLQFPISASVEKINLNDSIVSVGSCFADSIGRQLVDFKFNILTNPFGTIYNPISLSQILTDQLNELAVVESQSVHYHWQAHGEVSALNVRELQTIFTLRRQQLQERLSEADWLIITLGSAFAYRLKSSGSVVANCHKVPQSEFTKELLSVEEMIAALSQAVNKLAVRNSKFKAIITVSPVRHIRDGLVENNRSKARLIEVAHVLCEQSKNVHYFPAYEIQLDELRDYRFYANDRVHPSDEAVEYIWNRFSEAYLDDSTRAFVGEWRQIRSALQHRPFHPQSSSHQQFLRDTLGKLNKLSSQVDVSAEVSLLQKQLI